MDHKPWPQKEEKDPSHKKVYVKPEVKYIPLDDEEGLLEFCRGKPYDVEQLKEMIKGMLRPTG
jgi:hypothetical protein